MNLKSIVFLVIRSVAVVSLVGCESVFEEDLDEEDIEPRVSIVGTYEAENFTFQSSCAKGTSHLGYSGTGYMDYGGNNSLVEWGNVKVPSAGQYTLTFRFANGSSNNRQCFVTLNDTTNLGNVSFQPTGAWATWKTVSLKANLKAGSNKIRVTANTSNGGPNLDKMEVISEGSTSGPCAVANENSTATLSCPSGQVIGTVTFASYGTPSGSCPNFSTSSCHASTSKSKVEAACLNKPSCTVGATNSVFGDPCPGTYKKLAVAYTCRNITTANPCAQVSENSTANPSCPSGQVIRSIGFASYGTPTGSCPNFSTSSCHASTSKSKVEAACLNKPSCNVGANNSVFGDPCPGIGKKLAFTYSCSSGGVTDTDTGADTDTTSNTSMPVFLLAGQSNMEGNVDQSLFYELLNELGTGPSGTLPQRLNDRLTSWYRNNNGGYAMYGYSPQRVALEASELVRLKGAGLVNASLTQPYSKVLCTRTDSAPQALALNCGNPYGPELMLGHVLGTTAHSPTSLIKVAKGGTSLKVDWLPPSAASRTGQSVGPLYQQLSQRIKSLQSNPASVHPNCTSQKCRWAAFIWFQGENDTFDSAYAQSYQQNLVNLISDVRAETKSPQLPVIIVEIGDWAQSMSFGNVVADAQEAVVQADPYAALVVTDDLSGFFHYDPAAQLIIGERIAKTLVPMLK